MPFALLRAIRPPTWSITMPSPCPPEIALSSGREFKFGIAAGIKLRTTASAAVLTLGAGGASGQQIRSVAAARTASPAAK
jgi:hypothetical protein